MLQAMTTDLQLVAFQMQSHFNPHILKAILLTYLLAFAGACRLESNFGWSVSVAMTGFV